MSFLTNQQKAFAGFLAKWMPRLKAHWKKHLRATTIIFTIVFVILITVDQLSKGLVFNGDRSGDTGGIQSDWGILAFRSQFHSSTTFLDFIGSTLPRGGSLAINYFLILIFTILLWASTTRFAAFAISVALSGVIGNTIDATYWYGVRNVLYLSWASQGVFNFADAYIVVGTPLIAIAYIVEYFVNRNKAKHSEKITPADLDLKMTNEAVLNPKVASVKAPEVSVAAMHPDAFPELTLPRAEVKVVAKPSAVQKKPKALKPKPKSKTSATKKAPAKKSK